MLSVCGFHDDLDAIVVLVAERAVHLGSFRKVDLVGNHKGGVDLIVNTPWGRGARTDGYLIRRKALMHGVPCITTLAGAAAAVQGIESKIRGGLGRVNSLQSLYATRA